MNYDAILLHILRNAHESDTILCRANEVIDSLLKDQAAESQEPSARQTDL
jgi:hypothetical protein